MKLVGTVESPERRVADILHRVNPKANLDQRFGELHLDSLDYIDFIIQVENEFDCDLPDKTYLTVRDIVKQLETQCVK
jgi:acyl carrier protein